MYDAVHLKHSAWHAAHYGQNPKVNVSAPPSRASIFLVLTKLSQNLTKTEDFDGFFAENGVFRCNISF